MDFFSTEFVLALLSIVFIDLVLAGDNAIVIAMAARNLPAEQQKKAVIWGTFGAVAIRALATLVVVWLLDIPGLLLIGGIVLIWIAYKLLIDEKEHDGVQAGNSLWVSVRTIIVADAAMGLDNVIAVAGAANGEALLVILGLLISIPIVVWGSTLFIKWINRFPVIIYVGSGVLAYTAAKMITHEPFLEPFMNLWVKWLVIAAIIGGVLIAGKLSKEKKKSGSSHQASAEFNK